MLPFWNWIEGLELSVKLSTNFNIYIRLIYKSILNSYKDESKQLHLRWRVLNSYHRVRYLAKLIAWLPAAVGCYHFWQPAISMNMFELCFLCLGLLRHTGIHFVSNSTADHKILQIFQCRCLFWCHPHRDKETTSGYWLARQRQRQRRRLRLRRRHKGHTTAATGRKELARLSMPLPQSSRARHNLPMVSFARKSITLAALALIGS